ncbi:MAG: GtrA family protein [Bacteroidia bacterium]|nr:GtrA family protein [Bacteroidia bacterium]
MKQIKAIRKWIRQYPMLHKFLKFGFVGCASTVASLMVFWLIAVQFPQLNLLSKAIGYIMGFFVGFSLNKFWTYVDQTEDGEKYLLKYIVVYGITFFVYLLFNYVCDHYIHPERFIAPGFSALGLPEWADWLLKNGTFVSNILSIGVNVVLNFLGTNFLVFRVPEPKELFDEN